ncbi:hypothetical protein BZB76_6131 [Actinomadura pelletieri DSM 43383]|uniref:Uncharacterized protein n=1 Tax=Actinomadura pelletieri DSM 43383 TaxID=1120940 RepID=A0A495QBD7_9ACTN|nr:hypothetical protein BZB76_6131 [Actinomadura pelletieri DSM 43383]
MLVASSPPGTPENSKDPETPDERDRKPRSDERRAPVPDSARSVRRTSP